MQRIVLFAVVCLGFLGSMGSTEEAVTLNLPRVLKCELSPGVKAECLEYQENAEVYNLVAFKGALVELWYLGMIDRRTGHFYAFSEPILYWEAGERL